MSDRDDYEYVTARWIDISPMAKGRFDIIDMEGNVDYRAARAYTDAVLAEAARMREEIAQVTHAVEWTRKDKSEASLANWTSILSRLQALYDAHVRGLKSEALKGTR